MKMAILSDIHANLHALQAVWQDLASFHPDAVYCLGDLVGYGAYPNETIAFIRERQIPTIMGNYDEGVGFNLQDCGCAYNNPLQVQLGQQSLKWTQEFTTEDNQGFLRSLLAQIRIDDGKPGLLLVHGSPRRINEYMYEDRPEASFDRIARLARTEILLFGHTHLPYEKRVAGTLFVNCGSVGKPKDGDPNAGYVMLTLGQKTEVTFRRVAYDIASAARAIRACDLPNEFATALETGGVKTPSVPGE
ncbi:MAG: metallophosphoesterase [Anaerolineales bacterium]|nr:MAG: metallophosphoesterase [Anaerolineales bacterium]